MSDISDIDQEHICCLCDNAAYLCEACGHATCVACLSTWEDCPVCPSVCLACTMLALEVGATGVPWGGAGLEERPGGGRDDGVHCAACGAKTRLEVVKGAVRPGGRGEHQYRCEGCGGVMCVRGTPALAAGLEGCWFLFSSAASCPPRSAAPGQSGDATPGLRVVGREPGPMQPGEAAEGLEEEEQHGL